MFFRSARRVFFFCHSISRPLPGHSSRSRSGSGSRGSGPQPWRRAGASTLDDMQLPGGQRGSPCIQPLHDGSSQPKSLSLRDGTWSGLDTDLHSPDTFTDHQRPHPRQDFWQCGCTVHSCTTTAQIRDGVRYCEPQSSGENNLHYGQFISCLSIVSTNVNSCSLLTELVFSLLRLTWCCLLVRDLTRSITHSTSLPEVDPGIFYSKKKKVRLSLLALQSSSEQQCNMLKNHAYQLRAQSLGEDFLL